MRDRLILGDGTWVLENKNLLLKNKVIAIRNWAPTFKDKISSKNVAPILWDKALVLKYKILVVKIKAIVLKGRASILRERSAPKMIDLIVRDKTRFFFSTKYFYKNIFPDLLF